MHFLNRYDKLAVALSRKNEKSRTWGIGMRWKTGASLLVLCLAGSEAFAEATKPFSLGRLDSLAGRVDVVSDDHVVKVMLAGEERSGDRLFEVEFSGKVAPPAPFSSDGAQVFYWKGHLVVVAPNEGKALHFSVPGYEGRRISLEINGIGTVKSGKELDLLLQERYKLTRISTAMSISSTGGPQALLPTSDPDGSMARAEREKVFYQDPNPTLPGDGSCGSSCSTNCRDGSFCSVTCGPNRCASCSCPAACICR